MMLRRTFSSDSEGEGSGVKILINDVTPCDSRECLQAVMSGQTSRKGSVARPPGRRASWSELSARSKLDGAPLRRCCSLGADPKQQNDSGDMGISFQARFNNTKNDSLDSIPDRIKEKQRSFSAGSREDVFMFCNQLQDSVQSMSDMMSGNSSRNSLSINIEPKVVKKHSLVTLGRKNSRKEEWLIAPRSTLQKSVSTPSIVAAQEIQELAHKREGRDSLYNRNRFSFQNVRNSCIEIMHEDDETEELNDEKRLSTFSLVNIFRESLLKTGGQENEEDKPFSKRKKRGSLFFRKKKNKEKEKKGVAHQFVSICYSTAATCDVCSRALANKSALKCENCSVTVHDSSCKDHVPHCFPTKTSSSSEKDLSTSFLAPSGSIHYPPRYQHIIRAFPLTYSQSMIHIGKQSAKEKKSSLTDTTRINLSSTDSAKTSSPSNKVISEEKEAEPVEEVTTNILETNSASMESLDEGSPGASDTEDDTMLQLLDEEPETWNGTVDKKLLKKLKDRDLKRQEAIYELILTEKHHCLTLKVMQRVFAKGMMQELGHSRDMVQRLFPYLEQLLRYHLSFLQNLRERQRQEVVVSQIGDVLLQQFEGQNADDLCQYYSQFCSQHKDALSLYKDILKTDRKFQSFVKKCSTKPFCKARGIPECILLVTQRLTKYPLLIDALLKSTKDNKLETERLHKALANIKEIVYQVNSAVAEKDRETRLLEIYNRIDAKSNAFFKRKKFKKSDLLSDNRKLRFEGTLEWKSARGKVIDVHVIILSDVIVLLQENNQKYTFASLDNKAAVISLPKLLVREKAGQNSRGLYLISSNPSDPEMYEMLASSPNHKKEWLRILKESVTNAAQEARSIMSFADKFDGNFPSDDEISSKIADFCASMQERDVEIVTLCEDKIRAMFNALTVLGYDKQKLPNIDFQQFLQKDEDETERLLIANLSQASVVASRLFFFDTNPYNNSMENTSTSMSPVLPKRAETFGGFDNSKGEMTDKAMQMYLKRKLIQLKEVEGDRELSSSDSNLHIKPKSEGASSIKFIAGLKSPEMASSGNSSNNLSGDGCFNRIEEVAELNQLLATVTSLLHHHLSLYRKEWGRRRYRPDQQLEELRDIQERLSQERLQWEKDKAKQERDFQRKKEELLHLQKLLSGNLTEPLDQPISADCNCQLSLCLHKRSASFDFRSLGAATSTSVGGRQSWSGPIDLSEITQKLSPDIHGQNDEYQTLDVRSPSDTNKSSTKTLSSDNSNKLAKKDQCLCPPGLVNGKAGGAV